MGSTIVREVGRTTVLYDGRETTLEGLPETDAGELWLELDDLPRTTSWELKPEGVCKGEVCVPVPEARRAELLGSGGDDFNLSEFARRIEQPFAHDEGSGVWLFGLPGWEWRAGRPAFHQAPDFVLPDLEGKPRALSELRGKKVFFLFWATW